MNPDYVIIIGGGSSINTGLKLDLKNYLINKNVITINYAFLHFPHTFMTYVDRDFYLGRFDHPNITDKLKKEPLIIGLDPNIKYNIFDNTILLKGNTEFHTKPKEGFYNPILCGLWTLHIAMWLLDYKGYIYLLGYDFCKGIDSTHYYDDIKHRGINFLQFYNTHEADELFKPFQNKSKIYNVIGNPESKLTLFEKITYIDFIQHLYNLPDINYEEVRKQIKQKIHDYFFISNS